MWHIWLSLIISSLGGSLFLHCLKKILLQEKITLTWDWDGIIERGIVTYLIIANRWLYLILLIIFIKVIYRIIIIGLFENLTKITEPGTIAQKVRLKAELGFDLILSPAFAILTGLLFKT